MTSPEHESKGSKIPIRTRRSHGKSRSGCICCKKRRIKCDEGRPKCNKCKILDQDCIYPIARTPAWKKAVSSFSSSSTTNNSTKEPTVDIKSPSEDQHSNNLILRNDIGKFGLELSPTPTENSQIYDSHDVLLLMHFASKTSTDLIGSQKVWIEDAMHLAFQHKFLMHAILTLSARHLQTTNKTASNHSAPNYKLLEAYHLQTCLSTFHTNFRNAVHSNQDAVLATSFLLGFHAYSTLEFKPCPNDPCEDTSFTFLRGIRTIVIDRPSVAHSGRFKSLITPPMFLRHLPATSGPSARFLSLLKDLPPNCALFANRGIYTERITSLEPYFSTSSSQQLDHESMHELLLCFPKWQSFCPAGFVDLVGSCDPIALVILAHFYATAAYMLSRVQGKWWWMQEKPAYMVRTIDAFLKEEWKEWMEWPNAMLLRSQVRFDIDIESVPMDSRWVSGTL